MQTARLFCAGCPGAAREHFGAYVADEAGLDDASLINAVRSGQFAAAERIARRRIALEPTDYPAWAMLALSFRGTGEKDKSIACFEQAVRNDLAGSWVWASYGTVLREAGRLDDARVAYQHAIRIDPDNAEIWTDLGYLFVELGFVARARDALLRALALQPDMPEVRVHAARMCMECGEDTDAERVLADWPRWVKNLDGALKVDLASELIRLGQGQAGQDMLRALREDATGGHLAIIRLAAAQERLNDVDAALETAALLPPSGRDGDEGVRRERAMLEAALLERAGDIGRARGLLEATVDYPGPRSTHIAALFQLAKLCDKAGDTRACMGYLARAHAEQADVARQLVPELLRPESVPLGITDTRVTVAEYQAWRSCSAPDAEHSPIFVLGFPRSGTTMLEQMLDAHADLKSMDEQPFAQRVIERMESFGLRYPEDLGQLDESQCEAMRDSYWSCVAKVLRLHPGQRLVDKNPLTMLRLPLLKRIFPHSKIVFVVRHPCDVLLSCYMQHFNAPAFTVLCSSIDRLSRGYARAMGFWLDQVEVLQPSVHEWCYEDALDDFDTQVARLGEYLLLEDTRPLKEFSAHARAKGYIGTPSYAQVVKPLYKTSRGRWQKYRELFEPALPVLAPVLQHWGYRV